MVVGCSVGASLKTGLMSVLIEMDLLTKYENEVVGEVEGKKKRKNNGNSFHLNFLVHVTFFFIFISFILWLIIKV